MIVHPYRDILLKETEGASTKGNTMTRFSSLICTVKIWRDNHGQDLIEYALMAGFVAVAAGAVMPNVATSISTIFSKIASTMTAAAAAS